MMRLAFYAPMESPDHQFPSVDGKIARKLIKVLRLGGNIVSIASHFQSYNDTGQSDRLESIRIAGKCHANNIIEEIQEHVNTLNNEFSNPEQLKKFFILPRDFSVDDGELTPTLKIRRKQINENWAKEIEEMY